MYFSTSWMKQLFSQLVNIVAVTQALLFAIRIRELPLVLHFEGMGIQ